MDLFMCKGSSNVINIKCNETKNNNHEYLIKEDLQSFMTSTINIIIF